MRIKSLSIKNFRNLKKIDLNFDKENQIFAFIGQNAQGKTNLLEAIYLLSISKSFRSRENLDLINFENDFTKIKIELASKEDINILEIIISKNPNKKILKINGVQKKAVEFIAKLNIVFFSPDDIAMIHSSPNTRRRYLDILISQIDKEYILESVKYQNLLKQRNALLKNIAKNTAKIDELDFWDKEISISGKKILKKRLEHLDVLIKKTKKYFQEASIKNPNLEIKYINSFKSENTINEIKESRHYDILSGNTNKGPHRDDIKFILNGKNMSNFASRGEWRTLILSLKFAEISILKEINKDYPILLLDDVFSELDDERQKILFNQLNKFQTFISTTNEDFLKVIELNKKIYHIKNGEIIK